MYKIGTGENGTVSGKVYLIKSLNVEGDLTWTFCTGKLYLRKPDLPLGTIAIYDPEEFKFEGNLKLNCEEILTPHHSYGFNRYHPLLSFKNELYAIMMKVVEVDREIKIDKKEAYEKLTAKKKVIEEKAQAKKKLKDAQKKEILEAKKQKE